MNGYTASAIDPLLHEDQRRSTSYAGSPMQLNVTRTSLALVGTEG